MVSLSGSQIVRFRENLGKEGEIRVSQRVKSGRSREETGIGKWVTVCKEILHSTVKERL